MMRELARGVMRHAEGLVAFSHLAETLIPLQAPLPSEAPSAAQAQWREPAGKAAAVAPTPEADESVADPLQAWREASDAEFISHLNA